MATIEVHLSHPGSRYHERELAANENPRLWPRVNDENQGLTVIAAECAQARQRKSQRKAPALQDETD